MSRLDSVVCEGMESVCGVNCALCPVGMKRTVKKPVEFNCVVCGQLTAEDEAVEGLCPDCQDI